MHANWNFKSAAVVTVFMATALMSTGAKAIDVEVARKCNALLAKEFPPRQAGNPAAGSAKGSGLDQRNYFKKCVDKGGNIDRAPDKNSK
jgi:hypothetical protein